MIVSLWEARDQADIVITSRYVPGGGGGMPAIAGGVEPNPDIVFTKAFRLGIPTSRETRLYRRSALRRSPSTSTSTYSNPHPDCQPGGT